MSLSHKNTPFREDQLVKNMKNKAVLVVGDIMLDRFIYGSVSRISPESPVPVLSVKRENKMLGGAGNTLFNLVNLKCDARILSIVGDDDDGKEIASLLEQNEISSEGLLKIESHTTTVKTRFLAGHQQLLRTDFERVEDISKQTEEKLLLEARKLLSDDIKAIIISDYGKGLLTNSLIQSIISLAKDEEITTLVDPKGYDYSIYRGADVITPNKKELSEAVSGMAVETDQQVALAAHKLIKESKVKSVVATRSKDGMSIIQDKSVNHIKSASDIEVFDVSGAGDTVIATLAASLAAGANLDQAASLANIAGSIVVSKVGTAPIRAKELLEVLNENDLATPQIERIRKAPTLTSQEAQEEVKRWKARGLKVGFTNGCFDILHLGHVNYLNDARRKCDRLVVGLNSDESIRMLKGSGRPIHNESSRATVMSALGAVDMVVVFGAEKHGDDNTACKLLSELQPDIYFKGGDYTEDQIPETPTVKKYGGIVDIMPVYDGHSTTKSIEKMKNDKVA